MENRNIIIILVVIIAILAIAIGAVLFSSHFQKDPSVLKVTSGQSQNEGGKISVILTDLSENPISKEIVNIKVTNSKGKVVVDDVVKTDGNGKAKLDMDLKKGKYDVVVTFAGNDKYAADNATQELTIKEKEVAAETQSSSEPQRTAYAYKSDGTPMYSQAEVDSYMYNKYGSVNYHLQDNGYVNLDEPGFDDKGNYVGFY